MKTFICVICGVFICVICGSGCGPTYKDADIGLSIVKTCQKEYNTYVKVKRIGRTLGIYLPVNGLFESAVKVKGQASVEDILGGIKFTKEAIDKMDNVSLALSRAALSTDANVDFYVMIVADTKGSGLEIIITRYGKDMKRLILGDLSRGDYVQRLLMDVGFDPAPSAAETVKDFFYDLERLKAPTLIARYFSKATNVRMTSANFFLYLAELDYKQQKKFYVIGLKALQIEKNRVLVNVRVKEKYTPLPGYENFRFLYPSGFEHEYLIVLDIAYIPYLIDQIVQNAPYPEKIAKYQEPSVWDDENFFLEEVKLPDFLAQQLAARIRWLYQSDIRLKNKYIITLAKGEYQPAARKFKIILDIEKKGVRVKGQGLREEEIDFKDAWAVISQVMRRYGFKDYDAVELLNIADARREVIQRDELLNKFWPKWLIKRQG